MTKIACLMAVALFGLACSSTSPGTSPRADASDDTLGTASPDADPSLPAGMSAPEPPDVACTGQADAAIECDLPPSTCALWPTACDAGNYQCLLGSPWIVYYQNPRCVAGHCVWDQAYFQCQGGQSCRAGACMSILTTA
jgi:hypothetical protein